jgi:hypothetical protein
MGGMYGAIRSNQYNLSKQETSMRERTYIALVIHMRPISEKYDEKIAIDYVTRNLHHRKIWMTLYPWFANSEGWVPLEQLKSTRQLHITLSLCDHRPLL